MGNINQFVGGAGASPAPGLMPEVRVLIDSGGVAKLDGATTTDIEPIDTRYVFIFKDVSPGQHNIEATLNGLVRNLSITITENKIYEFEPDFKKCAVRGVLSPSFLKNNDTILQMEINSAMQSLYLRFEQDITCRLTVVGPGQPGVAGVKVSSSYARGGNGGAGGAIEDYPDYQISSSQVLQISTTDAAITVQAGSEVITCGADTTGSPGGSGATDTANATAGAGGSTLRYGSYTVNAGGGGGGGGSNTRTTPGSGTKCGNYGGKGSTSTANNGEYGRSPGGGGGGGGGGLTSCGSGGSRSKGCVILYYPDGFILT